MSAVRVVIADDQALVRAGFRMILEAQPDIDVVAEAGDGAAAVAAVHDHRPDVVLMDIRMPGMDGIAATRQLAAEGNGARVVILTTFDVDDYVFDALRAGASGFLLKDVTRDELAAAVRAVAGGDALLSPSVTRTLIEDYVRRPLRAAVSPARLDVLTTRERETLELIAGGLTNGEIAAHLYVSEATVKTHIGHILTKLHLRDRVQAVILAYEVGLVAPGGS